MHLCMRARSLRDKSCVGEGCDETERDVVFEEKFSRKIQTGQWSSPEDCLLGITFAGNVQCHEELIVQSTPVQCDSG